MLSCVFLIASVFYATYAQATPCVVSRANVAHVDFFEVELNGELYLVETTDNIFKADLEELNDGMYDVSVWAVHDGFRFAPVYFTVLKYSDKNKSYYSITPDQGYEPCFIEPLTMTINTKAGKAVGN